MNPIEMTVRGVRLNVRFETVNNGEWIRARCYDDEHTWTVISDQIGGNPATAADAAVEYWFETRHQRAFCRGWSKYGATLGY